MAIDAPARELAQLLMGAWQPGEGPLAGRICSLEEALAAVDTTAYAIVREGGVQYALGGTGRFGAEAQETGGSPIIGIIPPQSVSLLGDPSFCTDHGLRYPCCSGAMANGIGSEEVVEAMGKAGMLGFFGAAGLPPARVEQALQRLTESMKGAPYGFNLINSPNETVWQEKVADLYIQYGVRLVEASAYVSLSLPLIKYRLHGIYRDEDGTVVAPNAVIAKLSRLEVATRFFSPPPERMVQKLVEAGQVTAEQAEMAKEIPMAQDVTVEADSGGHTDHRPAIALLPTMLQLRDELQAKFGYKVRLRVGLAGGISTPGSAAGAFAMGADYVVTGSVNQACREAGTSDFVKQMLAGTAQTDVGEAPAADMFEMGVTVQVLKKSSRFVIRGMKLWETYRTYPSMEAIPAEEKAKLEAEIFRMPMEQIWEQTKGYFEIHDPRQIQRAEENPRTKMALVFRWYLGQSSGWAKRGVEDRQEDYQIWCGPAMGAFNEWVQGTYLEGWEDRHVAPIAKNVLLGAAILLRAGSLRRQGLEVPPSAWHVKPLSEEAIEAELP
jgi:trans-AT polyketide synthase/acyltransferase/oxidoreductase domain-containing protein